MLLTPMVGVPLTTVTAALLLLPSKGNKLGETVLYFGCRRKNDDYIYEEELVDFHQKGVLSGLHVAFSRDKVRVEASCLLSLSPFVG